MFKNGKDKPATSWVFVILVKITGVHFQLYKCKRRIISSQMCHIYFSINLYFCKVRVWLV